MANHKIKIRTLLSTELRNNREAIELAQHVAEKLATTAKAPQAADEKGNEICKIEVP